MDKADNSKTHGYHTEVIETVHGTLEAIAGDYITEQIKHIGGFNPPDLAMIRSLLKHGDEVIDVGAHIGSFSIPIARVVGSTGHVYSFEPLPVSLGLLRRNIDANGLGDIITTFGQVVASRSGFHVPESSPRNLGNTAFRVSDGDDDGLHASTSLDHWWMKRRSKIGPIRLIKIDVEGSELGVLRSASRLIENDDPLVYCEVNADALLKAGSSIDELQCYFVDQKYHLFVNLVPHNTTRSEFRVGRIAHLSQGGTFFDLLAAHPDCARYPHVHLSLAQTALVLRMRRLRAAIGVRTRGRRYLRAFREALRNRA